MNWALAVFLWIALLTNTGTVAHVEVRLERITVEHEEIDREGEEDGVEA